MELVSIKAKRMCIHPASRAFLPLTLGFSVQSTLSRVDTFGTGTKSAFRKFAYSTLAVRKGKDNAKVRFV